MSPPPEPVSVVEELAAPAAEAPAHPASRTEVAAPSQAELEGDGQRRSEVSDLPTEVMALPAEQETRPVPQRSEPLRPVPPVAPAAPAQSYVEDPRERYRYWIRYLLTGIAIAIMLIILAWAFTELREALGEVWDLFQEEEIDDADIGTEF